MIIFDSKMNRNDIRSAVYDLIESMKEGCDLNPYTIDYNDIKHKIREKFVSSHDHIKYSYPILLTTIADVLDNQFTKSDIDKIRKELDETKKINQELTEKLNNQTKQVRELTEKLNNQAMILKRNDGDLRKLKSYLRKMKADGREQIPPNMEVLYKKYIKEKEKHKKASELIDELQEEIEHLNGQLEWYSDICPTYP